MRRAGCITCGMPLHERCPELLGRRPPSDASRHASRLEAPAAPINSRTSPVVIENYRAEHSRRISLRCSHRDTASVASEY